MLIVRDSLLSLLRSSLGMMRLIWRRSRSLSVVLSRRVLFGVLASGCQSVMVSRSSRSLSSSVRIMLLDVSCKRLTTVFAEDELVSTDELQEKLQTDFEDYIQSTDIAAMQSMFLVSLIRRSGN